MNFQIFSSLKSNDHCVVIHVLCSLCFVITWCYVVHAWCSLCCCCFVLTMLLLHCVHHVILLLSAHCVLLLPHILS
jgi:hypothetical protein